MQQQACCYLQAVGKIVSSDKTAIVSLNPAKISYAKIKGGAKIKEIYKT